MPEASAAAILKRPVVQIAYHVTDIPRAAERMARDFGAGPFFLAEHIPVTHCLHRGTPRAFDHSSAYGQLGSLMVELTLQHNEGPSVFRDLYGPHEEGLHHMAIFAQSLDEDLAAFARGGYSTAHYATLSSGYAFAMVDLTNTLGHFIELYEYTPPLQALYQNIRAAAETLDGTRLLRPMAELFQR